MKIRMADLPGIGKKISMVTSEQSTIALIVHHTGKRDLYFFGNEEEEECGFSVTLTAEETRELGAQLLGAAYQPVDLDQMKMFKNQIVVEWVDLQQQSILVDKTIAESRIRTKTGASVIGVVRGTDVVPVPDIHCVLHAGDTLMVVGKSEQVEQLIALCKGEELS